MPRVLGICKVGGAAGPGANPAAIDGGGGGVAVARSGRMREDDIPGLELGEPEEAVPEQWPRPRLGARSSSEKHVEVDPDFDTEAHHAAAGLDG